MKKDYGRAEAEFKEAIRLNPQLFEAYYFYGRMCFVQVQTIFNNNRNSSNVSGATFYNTVAGGPWTGTTIYPIKSGSATQQSRTPATHAREAEIVMKSGVTYCFLFTSGTNDNLTNLVCEWYAHTPEND